MDGIISFKLNLKYGEIIMSKSKSKSPMTVQQRNHHSNQLNRNTGTNGANQANAKVHGNRGRQLNPNSK
jgi:hypothetical protein